MFFSMLPQPINLSYCGYLILLITKKKVLQTSLYGFNGHEKIDVKEPAMIVCVCVCVCASACVNAM